jgi:hypothetical protein
VQAIYFHVLVQIIWPSATCQKLIPPPFSCCKLPGGAGLGRRSRVDGGSGGWSHRRRWRRATRGLQGMLQVGQELWFGASGFRAPGWGCRGPTVVERGGGAGKPGVGGGLRVGAAVEVGGWTSGAPGRGREDPHRRTTVWGPDRLACGGRGLAAARSSGSSRRGRGRRAEAGRARGGDTGKNGGGRMVGGDSVGVGEEED